MFLIRRPSADDISQFIERSRQLPLSYQPIGIAAQSRSVLTIDELTSTIGRGAEAFERAKIALCQWKQFDLGWVEILPVGAPITAGTVVAVLVRHLGFWSLNSCRIVYTIGADNDLEFGYAYGTLPNHAETGEEIFKVRIQPDTGDVTYTLRAASRPRAPLAWLGYPITRMLQARFRRDSTRAVARATRSCV
jgi:uncharacterized protein (UPF0548 family)